MEVTNAVSVSLTLVCVHLWGLLSKAQADDCLSPVKWERLNPSFWYISLTNDCTTPYYSIYTTTYTVDNTTFLVAAILCSHTRYKLLIKNATDQNDHYRDIAASHGNGEDHCELVGTDVQNTSYIKVASFDKSITGKNFCYYRDGWGDPFKRGRIARWKSPRWYECGISIPSSKKTYGGCSVDENKRKKEKEKKEAQPTSTPPASLNVIKVIGIFIVGFIAFIALLYYLLKCAVKQSKLCVHQEEEPPPHTPPVLIPAGGPFRSAMSHVPARPSHTEASAPSPPPSPPPAPPSPSAPPIVPPSPSAPPIVPPWGVAAPSAPSAPSVLASVVRAEGAPPAYEEAENYPLVRPAEAEAAPPPYKEYESYTAQ